MNDSSRNLRINALAAPLVARLIGEAEALRVGVSTLAGATVVDAGIDHPGSLEAGRLIGEICMGGLGHVSLQSIASFSQWPWQVQVRTSQPVISCLGSQYAGWSLAHKEEGDGQRFHALGSGPARALARKEALFEELAYADAGDQAVLVLETDKAPPAALVDKVASDCGVESGALTFVLTPTGSLAGVVQIAARVVEVALHKAHELGFRLENVVEGLGTTPLPPPIRNGLAAMGRTNDTILFGGQVHLFVTGADEAAEQLARALPSGTSRDYGKPFAEVFKAYEYDFFKVDGMLFSPARVAVTAVESGRTFHAGALDEALLDRSFGG
ncbi:MAG: methenyltetrahydromethanopterin cyclohydrolase [Pseudomonadota bacterium]